MAKKRSWFNIVRRFFISESRSTQEKQKEKRRKWVFFGRMKAKSRLPAIAAPSPSPSPSPPRERTALCEAEEEQSKRALNVALATAAAAEAAVAAAHAAAEVVLLTGVTHSACQCDKQVIKGEAHEADREMQEFAAIKIQSIFRGYLARKALRALKGIVKLQAIIRGRNVRRQAMNTLKCLQSIVSIQSQLSAKRIQVTDGSCCCDENKQFANVLSDKIIKMDTNSQKRWDGSILTKEEAKALFLSKKEAAIKRERIKEYSFNHRNSAESERNKGNNGRWRYWLEQWVDTQVSKSKELEDLDTILTSNPKPRLEYIRSRKQQMMRDTEETETESPPPILRRSSFHRKQNSLGEETSFSKSPKIVPTYMASTESAKAKSKSRSMSSPKLRPASYDAYSDTYSPSKNRMSLVTNHGGKGFNYHQTSPSLRGIPAPVKSNHSTFKDLSFDSDSTFKTWNLHNTSGSFV